MDAKTASVISTGSLRLDLALGMGGIPRGQFVEIAGPSTSGKTTLCQSIVSQAQRAGGKAAWIDADHTFSQDYARRCGVDLGGLYLVEPQDEEQALDILETLIFTGSLAVVVVDSITSLTPSHELRAALGEFVPLERDQLLANSLRAIAPVLPRAGTAVIFTSQSVHAIYQVYRRLSHNTSRLALKLHASLRLRLRPAGQIRQEGRIVGSRILVRIIKNRQHPVYSAIELDLFHNNGIIIAGEIFDLGLQYRLIEFQPAGYFFSSQGLGMNRQEALEFLRKTPGCVEEIQRLILQNFVKAAH